VRETKMYYFLELDCPDAIFQYRVHKKTLNVKGIKVGEYQFDVPSALSLEEIKTWVVEYYNKEVDWRKDIKTLSIFYDFESARDFFIMKTGNHMGGVKIIHPD